MPSDHHDTLVYRLAQMLVKLNQGEKLDPHSLAEEFAVNLRTIQRDLNLRFAYLPLEKRDGLDHLDPTLLGKLAARDVARFACLAWVRGLLPSLSDDFLRDIFDTRMQSALLVKGHNYEDLAGKETLFRQLEQAIVARRHVAINCSKDEGNKGCMSLAPFKLMDHRGIWYLAARDGEKLKTLAFSRIGNLRMLDSHFAPEASIDKVLVEEDGIWFGEEKKEIVLKIAKEAAGYFKRRRLIANQVIEKELEDGGLIVSAKGGHPNQVPHVVRYWMPHTRIVSPEGLQAELERQLTGYVDGGR